MPLVEQDLMAARVSGRRYDQEVVVQDHCGVALRHVLVAERARAVGLVHHPRAPEVPPICYCCLRSYRNQFAHSHLNRQQALKILIPENGDKGLVANVW